MAQWLKEFQQGVETGSVQQIQTDSQQGVAAVKEAFDQWGAVLSQRNELVKAVTEKSQPDKRIWDDLNHRVSKIRGHRNNGWSGKHP